MNSWKSTLLSAWAPPLSTFIIGTGSTRGVRAAEVAPQRLGRCSAAGRVGRRERHAEDRVGAEPRLVRACRRARSARGRAPRWSAASSPSHRRAISPSTLATARVTPLPCPAPRRRRAAPSPRTRRSRRPRAPRRDRGRRRRSCTSTSTVGLPRLSRIWRAWTRSISLIGAPARSVRERSSWCSGCVGGRCAVAVPVLVSSVLCTACSWRRRSRSRQSVLPCHFFLKSLTKVLSFFCCCCVQQRLLDRRFDLRQRLLVAGLDPRDFEDVVAERALDRAAELVPSWPRTDAASRSFSSWPLTTSPSCPPLALLVGSIETLLGDLGEALAGFDFLSWLPSPPASVLVRMICDVALFRHAVAGLVFVVVLLDFRLADFRLLLDDLLLDFLREHVQLHAQQQVGDRLTGGLAGIFRIRRASGTAGA